MDNPYANIASPDDARAALANWKEKADKMAADAVAASEAVQELTAIGMDRNGAVAVKLNSSGAVVGVQFAPRCSGCSCATPNASSWRRTRPRAGTSSKPPRPR
nr:hypothetical protein GCM10025732_35800 [Glycomyces mayteni]